MQNDLPSQEQALRLIFTRTVSYAGSLKAWSYLVVRYQGPWKGRGRAGQ